ncbi:MAG: HAD hydrolase family protein [Kiritimatiellae bacterium]|nr:HAD hydrolase family protein [Kiritimatiellia bacterium]
MSTRLRCICLDFDGTIMVYDEPPGFFHPAAIEVLNGLDSRGVIWCTNSGRSIEDQVAILAASRARGLTHSPAAMLSAESYIHVARDGTYVPHEPWNTESRALLRRFHGRVRDALDAAIGELLQAYPPREARLTDEETVFLLGEDEEQAGHFREGLARLAAAVPDAVITQNGPWVVLLPDALGKGNVLRSFMEHRGLRSGDVLAIGDHLNDVSMLDGSIARYVGCPGDAMAEVKDAVRRAGGRVAEAGGPPGTVEVMVRYLG